MIGVCYGSGCEAAREVHVLRQKPANEMVKYSFLGLTNWSDNSPKVESVNLEKVINFN